MSLNGCLGPAERGAWRGVGRKGWQRVGEGSAEGWRRVSGFPCTLQFRNSRGARLETLVCDSIAWGREEHHPITAVFRGKCHDNKILNVQISLSRKFVVINLRRLLVWHLAATLQIADLNLWMDLLLLAFPGNQSGKKKGT